MSLFNGLISNNMNFLGKCNKNVTIFKNGPRKMIKTEELKDAFVASRFNQLRLRIRDEYNGAHEI